MSKAQRLVAFIIAVNIRCHFTIDELASKFGVSYRTIGETSGSSKTAACRCTPKWAQTVDIGWPTSACC